MTQRIIERIDALKAEFDGEFDTQNYAEYVRVRNKALDEAVSIIQEGVLKGEIVERSEVLAEREAKNTYFKLWQEEKNK